MSKSKIQFFRYYFFWSPTLLCQKYILPLITFISEAELKSKGFPAYTTSCGWLGYPDDKIRKVCNLFNFLVSHILKIPSGILSNTVAENFIT